MQRHLSADLSVFVGLFASHRPAQRLSSSPLAVGLDQLIASAPNAAMLSRHQTDTPHLPDRDGPNPARLRPAPARS